MNDASDPKCKLIALVMCLIAPMYSHSESTASDADEAGALGEIVVTAQRRSENLERTPVAVSVLTSDALAERDITTQGDLRTAVPGLTVRASLNSNDLNYSIRGQTVDAFSGSQPAVLPYINEVQVGGAGASAFYDLQSIQVLKGPQGTLFGKNSTGGAVLFTTAKPTDTLGGYFSASTGNYGLAQFEGALNVPVNDKVQARVAAFYESRTGFQYNTFLNNHNGDVDRTGARGSLTVKFTDSIKNDLVVDYLHAGGSSTNLVLSAVAPQFSSQAAIPSNLLYTSFLDTAIKFPGAFAIFTAGNPKIPPGGIYSFLALQNARGPYIVSDNNGDAHKADNLVISNITMADINEHLQFKNVFGFNYLRSADGDDADGSPYGIDGTPTGTTFGIFKEIKQFSEEPQLIGKALDGRLAYVTGLYFSHETTNDTDLVSFVDLSPIAPPAEQHDDTLTRDKSYAGYGQGTLDLSDATSVQGLSVSAGIRYTKEDVSMDQLSSSSFYDLPPPFANSLAKTFSKTSWQFGVQEQLNPNLLLYAVTRRSFRSGGFNNVAPPIPGFGNEGGAGFDAETATDVELGSKYQGSLLGVPARLNIALYDESIKNIQRVAYTVVAGSVAGLTVNVPKTRVSGVEVEGEVTPVRWLSLGTSFAYTDAKFTNNEVTLPGPPIATVGFGPYPDTPAWSGAVFSEVSMPITASLRASLRGEIYDQTKIYYSSTGNTLTPQTEISGYAITNFRLGINDSKAGWAVTANLKNAFNRRYYVGGLAAINVTTANAVIPGDPRTFVVTVRYNF